nr:hypothetical protein [uncultured bacterium]
MSLILAVALLGAVIVPQSSIGAGSVNGSDVDCRQHANHIPQRNRVGVKVNVSSLAESMHMRGQVNPIPELGGSNEVQQAVRQYCRQTGTLKVTITREGRKVASCKIRAQSDPNSGQLDESKKCSQSISPVQNEKWCVKVSLNVKDPDQQVAKSSKKRCGKTKRETTVVQLF